MSRRPHRFRPLWRFYAPLGSELMTLATQEGDVTEVPILGERAIRDVAERDDGRLVVLQGQRILIGDSPESLQPMPCDPAQLQGLNQAVWHGKELLLGGASGLFSCTEQGELTQLRDTAISGIWLDYAGRVWVGGHQLTCRHFAGESELPVPPGTGRVEAVHLGADGCLYVAFELRGLMRAREELDGFEPVEGLDMPGITSIEAQADQTIHATFSRGTRSIGRHGLVTRRPNGTFDRAHVFDAAEQIVRLADGRMLVASGPHLWTYQKRKWSEERPVWAGPPSVGYRLRPGRFGSWWLATNTGVGRWLPDRSLLSDPLDTTLAPEVSAASHLPIEGSAGELGVIPVLRIGWADGRFDRKERAELLRQLDELGYGSQTPLYRFALTTTKLCPSPVFFDRARHMVIARLADLEPTARAEQAAKILEFATAMADASGGFLGLGNRICREERELIEELEQALSLAR